MATEPDGPDPGERRARRDALLLELGALVYELHRRGRRAPELLQAKAAELDALGIGDADGGPAACPHCGEPAEPGQLVCLGCGRSLRPAARKRRSPWAVAAVMAAVVVGFLAAGGIATLLIGGSDDGSAGTAERRSEPELAPETEAEEAGGGGPSAGGGEPQAGADEPQAGGGEAQAGGAAPEAGEAEGSPQPARQSRLLEWPRNLTAHTVVLLNSGDRAAARRLALQASRSGIEAGLLSSEEYGLGSDLWIVFAGRFDTPEGAQQQAQNLAGRYPGAYVLQVAPG